MLGTFLADERQNAAAWYAERMWLLVMTQNGSALSGSLTNVGPAIEPGTTPQESTKLLKTRREITGTADGPQISVRSVADVTDTLSVELTGTLDGDQLNARIRALNEPPGATRPIVFRRATNDDVASVETEWTKNLNVKLGVQAEATLQARRNR